MMAACISTVPFHLLLLVTSDYTAMKFQDFQHSYLMYHKGTSVVCLNEGVRVNGLESTLFSGRGNDIKDILVLAGNGNAIT